APRQRSKRSSQLYLSAFRGNLEPLSITVLVPVHNDAAGLEHTLYSVQRAADAARNQYPGITVKILVGLDGCTDDRLAVAKRFEVGWVASPVARGKWRTIVNLAPHAEKADWIALADCGIVWNEDFFLKIIQHCYRPEIMGLAPTYHNEKGGAVERVLW